MLLFSTANLNNTSEEAGKMMEEENAAIIISEEGSQDKIVKEIKQFDAPKKVVKKTMLDIIIAQLIMSVAMLIVLFLLRLALPEVYENIAKLIENYISI